ncbi:MAG TPA: TlpA disulfide reductase family protein [Thauera sp.]|uniref:TlpA disulfide reductase family protein n=1 Tax=Thauera sp. TaxID=1905334 RepID=UPI002CF6F704|nr:TlpA disulfide reductase family protein [Thauera sp.]HRP22423.1 TlpA disulfide reductase family protein [Thauera sp.]HRP66891.1 TlpA disulfide reductase family protein [Thauera sp.]
MKPGLLLASVLGFVLVTGASLATAGGSIQALEGSPPAAELALPDTEGRERRLGELRGKVVLVNFWATWCVPCRTEMPALERLYQQLRGQGLEVLAVHVGPAGAEMRSFLAAVPLSFPVLVDADLDLAGWPLRGLPTTVVVDRSGRRTHAVLGALEWDAAEARVFLEGLLDGR